MFAVIDPDLPPPGLGLTTYNVATPGTFTIDDVTLTTNTVRLMNLVRILLPFQYTLVLGTKLLPYNAIDAATLTCKSSGLAEVS
jgi:hypothetical protein